MRTQGLFIGVAGWSIHSRYAAEFAFAGSHLQRYGLRLGAAEVNSSFYRPHAARTYERWASSTPDGFRFSVKAPRTMTHERRLAGCGELIGDFSRQVQGLGPKLGVVLVQLPPSLVFEHGLAAAFFDALKAAVGVPLACEPRHPSWFAADADAVLVAHDVARVLADPQPAAPGAGPGGCKDLIYWRLHGSPNIYRSKYERHALARIRAALDAEFAQGRTIWCIFDNTTGSEALGDALELAAMVPAG